MGESKQEVIDAPGFFSLSRTSFDFGSEHRLDEPPSVFILTSMFSSSGPRPGFFRAFEVTRKVRIVFAHIST
jgi:hypothetical protein